MVAILHEGYAKSQDRKLLENLLADLSLDSSRVQFYGMGTKNNFCDYDYKDYQELIQLVDADQIDKVLFTTDADFQKNDKTNCGYDNSLRIIKDAANHHKINSISQFHIFCDPNTREGNIESFLLSTLDEKKRACIDAFLECSDFKAKGNSKAILNQIYNQAYPDAPFDYKHKHFNELKQKLKNLFD